MKIYRSLEAVPSFSKRTALAIGNFDGLHLGHQKILKHLVNIARTQGLLSGVLTFSPHPEKIFGPEKISMIQTLEQRLEGIEAFGVDMALIIPFSRAFAELPGKDFVKKILLRTLQCRVVVVGSDFRFGKNRRGDISAMRTFGAQLRFDVHVVPPVRKKALIVSSSLIRELLRLGHLGAANAMLGRHYFIEGDVVRGEARGEDLGFPTANIETPNEIIPRGVFLTLTEIEEKKWPSLTNVGVRPTFSHKRLCVESHVLDFHKKIYGDSVKIHFLKKIREERAFANPGELSLRIRKDLEAARRYFKKWKDSRSMRRTQ
jgi:riboflavin kinase/FMN adenylyltransferase